MIFKKLELKNFKSHANTTLDFNPGISLIVGENGARETSGKYFKDGTLYCTINSSIVRSQLYYRKEDIIAQLNKMLNSDIVKKLILK